MRRVFVVLLLVSLCVPAWAHHSYAMFDRQRTVTVTGTVRTFQWTNPHVYLWVDVADPVAIYAFEFAGGPNGLARNGWTNQSLKQGDKVSVSYHPLKDGRTGGEFVSLVLADGTKMDSDGINGTSKGTGPT